MAIHEREVTSVLNIPREIEATKAISLQIDIVIKTEGIPTQEKGLMTKAEEGKASPGAEVDPQVLFRGELLLRNNGLNCFLENVNFIRERKKSVSSKYVPIKEAVEEKWYS